MTKLFAIFCIVTAICSIECVPVPNGFESFFESFPQLDTQNFEKEIAERISNIGEQAGKSGNGLTSSLAVISGDGHGRMLVQKDGKSYEKTFRK